jgi:hypothetical protein
MKNNIELKMDNRMLHKPLGVLTSSLFTNFKINNQLLSLLFSLKISASFLLSIISITSYYYSKKKKKSTNKILYQMKNVRFTTLIQQLYNNSSHEGGSHILGSTFM